MTKTTLGVAGVLAALGCSVALSAPAAAQTLLFDRGLPTTNLNNAAGSNRSNVAWGDNGSTSIGDNFTLSTGSVLDTIRVWVIDENPTAPMAGAYQLWLGPDASPGISSNASVTDVATSTSVTLTTYTGGIGYQGTSGNFHNMYEVDFTGLDLDENAGTYAFGVSGTPGEAGITTPFLEGSNGPLSGSTQMGDDGVFYAFDSTGAMDIANGFPTDSDGNGWDKSSDINVQVLGEVPEPASMAILGVGLFALGAIRRRRRA
jgi:hypothetical protein